MKQNEAPLSVLLPAVKSIARRAGIVIFSLYKRGFSVRSKPDRTPVTEADEAAEGLILAALAELTPGVPVVSEESFSRGVAPKVGKGRFWLVDPIDGTREFVNGTDEFTVNIALVENRVPVLGVIHAPIPEVTYAAADGVATMVVKSGETRPIHARRMPADGIDVVESRSHGNSEAITAFLEDYNVKSRRRIGSAVKLALVAAGIADLYPRFGPTMEWDTAAGHAILTAAGGHLRSLKGVEFTYGKPGFANPDFIATGLPEPARAKSKAKR